jgi:hypothetical protein
MNLKPDEKARLEEKLNVLNTVNANATRWAYSTPEQMSQMVQALSSDEFLGKKYRGVAEDMSRSMLQNHLKQRKEDSQLYAQTHYEDIEASARKSFLSGNVNAGTAHITKSNEVFDRLNIPESQRRYLTKDQASFLARSIDSAKDSEGAMDTLLNVQATYGKHTGKILQEMVNQGKLKPDYILAAQVSDEDTKRAIIDNIKNPVDESLLKEKSSTYTKSNIFEKVLKEDSYQKIKKAFAGVAREGKEMQHAKAYADQVTLEAMKYIVRDGLTDTEAIKLATKNIIDKNWTTVSHGESTLMIPKSIPMRGGNQEGIADAFLEAYTSAEGYQKLGIPIDNLWRATEIENMSGEGLISQDTYGDRDVEKELQKRWYDYLEDNAEYNQ